MTPASLVVLGTVGASTARGAEPLDRPPDAMVVSTCFPDSVGFVDVDGDGSDELTLQVGGSLFSWPSSRDEELPQVWEVPFGDAADPMSMASAEGSNPAQLLLMGEEDIEYSIDPITLQLEERFWEPHDDHRRYVSDIDGDGAADLTDWEAIRLSRSGIWQELLDCCDDTLDFFPWFVEPVGDLNQDGFGDVVVGQRTIEDYQKSCSWLRGPAQLYLGSPDGLQPEPVWTLWPDGHAQVGVGGRVVAIPGEDTLVVTMVKEGLFCDDQGPGFLGVIRDASTPEAYFAQVVELPEYDPSGSMPYLYGLMPDGAGGQVFALPEAGGGFPDGIRWYPWDEERGLVDTPAWSWSHPWIDLDVHLSYLALPPGRLHQVYLDANIAPDGTYELLIWGRSPEEVGPSGEPAGSTAAGCTFWAWPYLAPDPVVPPTTDTGTGGESEPPIVNTDPPRAKERDGCGGGCASSGSASGLAVLLALAAGRRQLPGSKAPAPRCAGRSRIGAPDFDGLLRALVAGLAAAWPAPARLLALLRRDGGRSPSGRVGSRPWRALPTAGSSSSSPRRGGPWR